MPAYVRYLQPSKPCKQTAVSGTEQLHHSWGVLWWRGTGADLTTRGPGVGAALL